MNTMTVLVTGIGISKEKKQPYATYLAWNERYGTWTKQRTKEGTYGEGFIFIDEDTYNALKRDLRNGVVCDIECEIDGFGISPKELVYA